MPEDTIAIDSEQLAILLDAVTDAAAPQEWEIIGAAATVVIALTAIVAARYTKRQIDAAREAIRRTEEAARKQIESAEKNLREIKNANEESAKFAKANFLLQLNNQFQSPPFIEARADFKTTRGKLEEKIQERDDYDKKTREELEAILAQSFSDHLYALRGHENQNERKKYGGMLNLCGFYENAAVLIKSKCIELDELTDLYGGAIVELHDCLRKHIEIEREKFESKGKPGYFANFTELAASVAPRLVELERKRQESQNK